MIMSRLTSLRKYRLARDWLKVCIPNFSWPICMDE